VFLKRGHLNIDIDGFTACLVDAKTSEELPTVVYKIEDSKILTAFNKKNGWEVSWKKLCLEGFEIYALVLKESPSIIQGLVALQDDKEAGVIIINWAVAAPHNRKPNKRYIGVGGHLFAIAIRISVDKGYGGAVIGHPANRKLDTYYKERLGAESFPFGAVARGYEYTIIVEGLSARNIVERYSYEEVD